jgi:hypothetical protein
MKPVLQPEIGQSRKRRISERAPLLVLILILLLLGVGIHGRARQAIAPPIYDPMAYYTKGAMVWREWNAGRLVNPLNVAPTVRPPGTLLLSSPTGFSPDFRGFLFRSIYFPVVLTVLAFWVLAAAQARTSNRRWGALVGALSLASLPMFYQFERSPSFASPYDWGYVDCLLGAVAALAAALFMASVRRRSLVLGTLGVAVGAFSLLLKPAGLLIMPILAFLWAVELAAVERPTLGRLRDDASLKRYLTVTGCMIVAGFAGVTGICLKSEYFSKTNLTIGYNGQKLLIAMFKDVPLLRLMSAQVHTSIGWHWFFAASASGLLLLGRFALRARRRELGPEDWRFLAGLSVFSIGIVWWVWLAGPAQIRYIYPFILMFAVVTLPDVLETAAQLSKWIRRPLGTACVVPVFAVVSMLLAQRPSTGLEKALGVNLSSGGFRAEVDMSDYLVDQARAQGRSLKIYVLGTDERPGVVEAEGIYRHLIDPNGPTFTMQRPNDWIRSTMVRRHEFVQSDYILFYPVRDGGRLSALLRMPAAENAALEADVFSAWLTVAGQDEGLQPAAAAGADLKLVKVSNPAKLDRAFAALIEQHRWRDIFNAENAEPVFLRPDAVVAPQKQGQVVYRDVHFGDRFKLSTASLTPDKTGLSVNLIWQSTAEQELNYVVFVHLVDKTGKILRQADYRQSGRGAGPGEVWSDAVELSSNQLKGVTGIAIGLYKPPDFFLTADKGNRDWDNRRLILSVPHQ